MSAPPASGNRLRRTSNSATSAIKTLSQLCLLRLRLGIDFGGQAIPPLRQSKHYRNLCLLRLRLGIDFGGQAIPPLRQSKHYRNCVCSACVWESTSADKQFRHFGNQNIIAICVCSACVLRAERDLELVHPPGLESRPAQS